jgi:hypothetical protein
VLQSLGKAYHGRQSSSSSTNHRQTDKQKEEYLILVEHPNHQHYYLLDRLVADQLGGASVRVSEMEREWNEMEWNEHKQTNTGTSVGVYCGLVQQVKTFYYILPQCPIEYLHADKRPGECAHVSHCKSTSKTQIS